MMCVGLTVTYLTTKVPNFAHADFVVSGIYASSVAYILWDASSPYMTVPLSFLVGGFVAVVVYLLVLRPLIRRGSSLVVLMISTLAVGIIFDGVVLLFIEYVTNVYGRLLRDKGYTLYTLYSLPDFRIFDENGLLFVAPIVLILMTVGMYFLLTRTKFGVAMRASIENANLAKTVGINVDRVYLVSWFIAGGLAGFAGGFYAIFTTTPQEFSTLLIVDIFAGSVLGGIGSVYGGIVGGLIVGDSEIYLTGFFTQLVTSLFGSAAGSQVLDFQKGIPLAILIIALLFAPQGLVSVRWRKLLWRKKS
jgi:branched-chain amino acid transport system permease protein